MAGISPKGEPEFNSPSLAHAPPSRDIIRAFKFLEDHCRLLDKKVSSLSEQIGALQDALEEERKQREKLESALHAARAKTMATHDARSQFLDNMSHEMRTPLNGILGMAQLMLKTPLNPEQRENIEIIQQSGQRLNHVLGDLLDYSRLKQGDCPIENQRFELLPALDEVISNNSEAAIAGGLELAFIPDRQVQCVVASDRHRLQQVLDILVKNAIKFTPAGHVAVYVDVTPLSRHKSRLSLRVEDTGIGIKEGHLPLIYEPFWQAELSKNRTFGGLGIGLSLCQELVARFDGSLEVLDSSAAGTVIQATLMLSMPDQDAPLDEGQQDNTRPEKQESMPLRVGLFRLDQINQKVLRNLLPWYDVQPSLLADDTVLEAAVKDLDVIITPTSTALGNTLNDLLARFQHGALLPLFIGLTEPDQQIHPNEKAHFDIFLPKPVLHGPLEAALDFARDAHAHRSRAGHPTGDTDKEIARILLIDPVKLNQKILTHILRTLGYEVVIGEPDGDLEEVFAGAPFEATLINTTLDPAFYAEVLPEVRTLNLTQPGHKLIGIQGKGAAPVHPLYTKAGITQFLTMPTSIDRLKALLETGNG